MNSLPLFVSRIPRLVFLVITSILLITMLGCAKRGPLKPKLHSLPAAPADANLLQQGNSLILTWTLPDKNEDGSKAEDLVGFKIRRLIYLPEDNCPTCRDPEEVVAKIDLYLPEPAERVGDRFYWRDTDVLPKYGYRYAIVPVTLGRQEGSKTLVHKKLQDPPPAPLDLSVTAGDRRVSLSWATPSLAEGCRLLGYNVYRRQYQRAYSLAPLNQKPLENAGLVDRGLANDTAYAYRVTALCILGEEIVESAPTEEKLITPQTGR